jgi:hypothetical protein
MQAKDKELILDPNAQNIGTSQIMEYLTVKKGAKKALFLRKMMQAMKLRQKLEKLLE